MITQKQNILCIHFKWLLQCLKKIPQVSIVMVNAHSDLMEKLFWFKLSFVEVLLSRTCMSENLLCFDILPPGTYWVSPKGMNDICETRSSKARNTVASVFVMIVVHIRTSSKDYFFLIDHTLTISMRFTVALQIPVEKIPMTSASTERNVLAGNWKRE